MKLATTDEKDLMHVYKTWWHSYLNGDVKTYDFYLTDDYRFIGSTNNEDYLNKKDTTKFFENTAEQMSGKAELRNLQRTTDVIRKDLVLFTDLADAYVLSGTDWVYYSRFRFTSLMKKTKDGWRFSYQHFSAPDSKAQEGETLGTEKITKENQELRDAIKRRTFELEKKNKELEIEAAIERVRTNAMSMHTSDDLKITISIVFSELVKLGLKTVRCGIGIFDDNSNKVNVWTASSGQSKKIANLSGDEYLQGHPLLEKIYENWLLQTAFSYTLKGNDLLKYYKKVSESNLPVAGPGNLEKDIKQYYYCTYFPAGGLFAFKENDFTEHDKLLMKRFSEVFHLSFIRHQDLKKAELQAREVQIELALEKVRSRTMAMQHSDELQEASFLLDQQVRGLGIKTWGCAFNIYGEKESTEWFGNEAGVLPTYTVPRTGIFKEYYQKGKQGESLLIKEFSGKACVDHYEYMSSLPVIGDVLKKLKKTNKGYPTYQIDHVVFFKYGYLLFITKEHAPEAHDIFKRFAKVFQQTYTRFLDLQKAEAQARESQIELALERVRARTMSMQQSDELRDTAMLLFQQVEELGIDSFACGFNIWDEDKKFATAWMAGKDRLQPPFKTNSAEDVYALFHKAEKRGESLFVLEQKGKELEEHYKYLVTIPEVKALAKAGLSFPTFQIIHCAYFSKGYLMFITHESVPEAHDIFKRFAKVFEQTYTRFLDLQKAEAQAKEAQIEAALERVRSRSMAMHKSDDLKEVIKVVYDQFVSLNINTEHTGFLIDYKENNDMHIWLADKNEVATKIILPYFDCAHWKSFKKAKATGKNFFANQLTLKEKNKFYRDLFKLIPDVKEGLLEIYLSYSGLAISTVLLDNVGLYIENFDGIPYTSKENATLMRFGKVFQQTYTRFLDLQKAEAQAREAKIETALEKVRSRSLAMQNSDELKKLIGTVYKELNNLDLDLDRCLIWIMNDEDYSTRLWMANREAEPVSFYIQNHKNPPYKAVLKGWKERDTNWEYHLKGKVKKDWDKFVFEETEMKKLPDTLKMMMQASKQTVMSGSFHSFGCLQTAGPVGLSEEQSSILTRFAKVFNQAYTRFSDLKRAEAQAKEAQIEASLERVRSKTMAMHSSQDVGNTMVLLFEELESLGIKANRNGIIILGEEEHGEIWTAKSNINNEIELMAWQLDMSLHDLTKQVYKAWKNKNSGTVYSLIGDNLKAYYKTLNKYTDIPVKFNLDTFPEREWCYTFNFSEGFIYLFTDEEILQEQEQIPGRFASVFGQTYRRYQDLQKAEAQAREAQIETALERIRSRSMAMHKTSELSEVIIVVFRQLEILNLVLDTCYIDIFDNNNEAFNIWIGAGTAIYPEQVLLPYFNHPIHQLNKRARKNNVDFFTFNEDEKSRDLYFEHFYENAKGIDVPKKRKKHIANGLGISGSAILGRHSSITLFNYQKIIYSSEENDILIRVNKVFQQTYIRFLDLKKAEAQAREAQIEAALEKVRSRSLAMHKPDELQEVVAVVAEKLKDLGVIFDAGGVILCTYFPDNKDVLHWIAADDFSYSGSYLVPYFDNPIFSDAWDSKIRGDDYYSKDFSVEDKNSFFEYAFEHSDYKHFPDEFKQHALKAEQHRLTAAWSKNSAIIIPSLTGAIPSESDAEILKRFAKVFEQAYIRFMDLQKAEAQARESQIEAALERVRSKTMAMHNSRDVEDTVVTFFDEVLKLGLDESIRCGIGILEGYRGMETRSANIGPDGKVDLKVGMLDMTIHPMLVGLKKAWQNGSKGYFYEYTEKDVYKYYKALNDQPEYPFNADLKKLPKREFHYSFFFSTGIIFAFTENPISEESSMVLSRFADVFGQTYRRYLDLRKAEAQTREALVEASLERVRSRTLAMQTSEELAETAVVLFKQLIDLGIEPNRLYIGIIKDKSGLIEMWATDEDGNKIGSKTIFDTKKNTSIAKIYNGWKKQEKSLNLVMEGEELTSYLKYLNEELGISVVKSTPQKKRFQTVGYFSKGFIGIAAPDEQPEETTKLLERFAGVFNLTYTRFNDLKIAEANAVQAEKDLMLLQTEKKKAEDALSVLKTTQTQLIQSEKMASLGELTAGIAHEIQNPLNFVNNFSEVSNELIDEMSEEIEKGDLEEAKFIMADIRSNLQKIHHHGKRADAIVKGMLQHSRKSTAEKEPTDINKLADEYLRLAYHGLRAKDKSFNANLETDYDDSIGKISLIPQDIGRVILNLITNAFYAVSEKSSHEQKNHSALQDLKGLANYEPTVWVSTKNLKSKITIAVRDNGAGIPKHVLDKIFQPFFTTKPTGQGTGLGLSMSYDIVTKGHNGELKVKTKEGKGTTFNIELPLNS